VSRSTILRLYTAPRNSFPKPFRIQEAGQRSRSNATSLAHPTLWCPILAASMSFQTLCDIMLTYLPSCDRVPNPVRVGKARTMSSPIVRSSAQSGLRGQGAHGVISNRAIECPIRSAWARRIRCHLQIPTPAILCAVKTGRGKGMKVEPRNHERGVRGCQLACLHHLQGVQMPSV
jgi:hypothetical protein